MRERLRNLCSAISQRRLWPIIVVIAFLTAVFLFYWIDYIGLEASEFVPAETQMNNGKAQYVVGEILSGDMMEQRIPLDMDIYGIQICFGTYNRVNSCTVDIMVYDADDQCVFAEELPAGKLKDNDFHDFIFGRKVFSDETDYIKVVITSQDGEEGNAVTVYHSSPEEYISGRSFYINGDGGSTVLTFRLLTNQKFSFLRWMTLALYLLSISAVLVVYFSLIKRDFSLEKTFVLAAVLLGLISNTIFPPNAIPDEGAHLWTAYNYTNQLLGVGVPEDKSEIYMRANDRKFLSSLSMYPSKNTYKTVTEQTGLFVSSDDSLYVNTTARTVNTPFTQYAAPIVGLAIARVLHLQALPTLYFARFLNLGLYIFCIYWAIRKTPVAKLTFFVTGLLPMGIHLAGSYSYDATVIGVSLLFTSWMLYLIYQAKEVQKKDVAICSGLVFLLPHSKAVYIVLIGLSFLIVKEKWGRLKKKWTCSFWALLGVLGVLFTYFGNIARLWNKSIQPIEQSSTYTLSWILENFGEALKMGIRTLIGLGSWYWNTMIGSSLGWLEIPVRGYLITILTICLFLSVFSVKEDECAVFSTQRQKTCMGVIVFLGVVLIHLVMFVGWTGLASKQIQGVQGRYFIPLLPLFLLLFRGKGIVLGKHVPSLIAVTTVTVTALSFLEAFTYIACR